MDNSTSVAMSVLLGQQHYKPCINIAHFIELGAQFCQRPWG